MIGWISMSVELASGPTYSVSRGQTYASGSDCGIGVDTDVDAHVGLIGEIGSSILTLRPTEI